MVLKGTEPGPEKLGGSDIAEYMNIRSHSEVVTYRTQRDFFGEFNVNGLNHHPTITT